MIYNVQKLRASTLNKIMTRSSWWFFLIFFKWTACGKEDKGSHLITEWPLDVMFPQGVVFVGLARLSFTLAIVNNKKRVIVLFNLPVFLLLPPLTLPPLGKTPHWWHMGAELSWQTHHPLLSDCWKGLDPPDPLDTEEQITLLECGQGQVEWSILV